MGPSEMPQIKYQNTKTKPASQKIKVFTINTVFGF